MAAPTIAFAAIVLFAAASFFFSLAETSLFSLSKWQVKQLPEHDSTRGAVAVELLSQPQELLSFIALGNTFTAAAMLALALWMALLHIWPIVLTLICLVAVTLIVCEVLPKTMAVRKPELWALRVARPLALMFTAVLPVSRLAQKLNSAILSSVIPKSMPRANVLTDADYHELLELAYQQGALAQSEKEIILQIISLDRRTVKEVMKPRSQMAAIADDLSIEDMIAVARHYKHRRLPIYDETPDTIVGILNTRVLLLDPAVDLADAIEFPSFVPETMNLLHLLKSLQRQQRGLAIVLDEFGGTAGIVTMEDILEEMVGRIRREGESEGFVMEKLGAGKWRVNGVLRLDDFRREYPGLPDVPDVETIGGLMMNLLEIVPAPGDSITFRGLKLTAKATDERRVREVLIETVK